MLWLAMLLWALACVAGTFGSSLDNFPRDGYLATASGEPMAPCAFINLEAVQQDPSVEWPWCTARSVLGPDLPADRQVVVGGVQWEAISWNDLAEVFGQPQLWLTLGLGLTR